MIDGYTTTLIYFIERMVIIMTIIRDIHTEVKVLRHLKDFPQDYQALKKTDFSGTTVRIYEAIRRFSSKVGDDDLAATCPDKGIVKSIIATDDENPDYWYEKLIKLSVLRQAEKLGWDEWVDTYVIQQESPDGEKDVIFTDNFENTSVEDMRNELIDYTDDVIKLCRQSYSIPSKSYFTVADEIPGSDSKYDWLVDGLIKERSFNELVAPSKSGKSQLAYQLAYEVQNGLPFLGLFNTKKCNVYYIDCELDPSEINEREGNLRAFEQGNERVLYHSTALEKTTVDGIIAETKKAIRKDENAGLIVLDNFYSFVDGEFDTNSVGEVSDLLSRLKLEFTTLGVAVVLVNHTNKAIDKDLESKSDSSITSDYILNSPFGSLAHGAKVDTTILLQKRKDNERRIHITGRKIYPVVRIGCTCDESTNYFFQPLAGNGDDVDKAISRLNKEQLEQIDDIFSKQNKDVLPFNTIKRNFIGKTLTREQLENAGYKKENKGKNAYFHLR